MKLLLVVLEGQLYLAGIVVVFVAELALLSWGLWSRRPLIGLLAVFGTVPLMRSTANAIRAFSVRTRIPDGIPLGRTDGRGLYELVEEIRHGIGGPQVDDIIVTGGFDAKAATYRPRWPPRRHRALVLGLPVLTTLSRAELRAVIAHELAHYASAHDAFAAWVYRTRRSWLELRASLDRRLATPVYVYWIIYWYVPRLDRAAAEVSRRHELVADRVAAQSAGSRAAADALVAFEAGEHFAENDHWPRIQTSHLSLADPPSPFSQMLTWDARHVSEEVLAEIVVDDSAPDDTHPSMKERLAGLGENPRLPVPVERSAGAEILGTALNGLARRLDEEWVTRNGDSWRRHRARYLEQRATVDRLAALDTPSADERYLHGTLVETLEDADAALPFYMSAAAEGHAAAGVAAGRLLLERADPAGIPVIEDAMSRDERLVPEGCRILSDYYRHTKQALPARAIERRARRHKTLKRLERPVHSDARRPRE
jgi:Zn-dependent protease with chaperone function